MPGVLLLLVHLVYYRDPQVGLPFGQILGQNGLAQDFNVKPMRPAQAIKQYHQPCICFKLTELFEAVPLGMPWVV